MALNKTQEIVDELKKNMKEFEGKYPTFFAMLEECPDNILLQALAVKTQNHILGYVEGETFVVHQKGNHREIFTMINALVGEWPEELKKALVKEINEKGL